MKKKVFKSLLLISITSLLFVLISCTSILEKLPFEIPAFSDNTDEDNGDGTLDGLVLIKNKVALFRIVHTSDAGADSVSRARKLVNQLRDMGVTIEDPISDSDASKVTDCEIIIGTGAKHRGDEVNISAREIGSNGIIVKIVGQRIVIAGGTAKKTFDAFESFITKEMKIDKNTKEINSLAVNSTYGVEIYTKYPIQSIKIADLDIEKYTFVCDTSELSDFEMSNAENFAEDIYNISGQWMEKGYTDKIDTYANSFIIRYTADAGDEGFRAFYDGKNFIVECSYKNAFNNAFKKFADKEFYKSGRVNIDLSSSYQYTDTVSVVTYADFGAKGNGSSDDFSAILKTHEYANSGGQKVLGVKDAKYFIYAESFVQTIPVKTDVDFNGATFIIDDTGSTAYSKRTLPLFTMERDYMEETLGQNRLNELREANNGTLEIKAGDKSIPWLASLLETDSMIRIVNSKHKDYIRYGSNQNSGENRREVLIVDKDGTVSSDTPIFFDYNDVTTVNIYRIDDKPITIENGLFYNICCKTVPETEGKVLYKSYNRGMRIRRSNVTFKEIDHRMIDEPDYGVSPDGRNFGDYTESYPYNRGFYYIDNTYNLTIQDCEIAGHTTYYEKKEVTASSGSSSDGFNYVPAGSYDFVVEESTHIYFKNVNQYNRNYKLDEVGNITLKSADTGIGDERYWGVMSSNFARNLNFDGCSISRIDAHMGFFNVTVKNSEIGHTFHAVGGGKLEVDNVTRITGDTFIVTRGDYGGTFKGDIVLRNCTLKGYNDYNSRLDQALDEESGISNLYVLSTDFTENDKTADQKYWNWNFGYDCYMPITVTFDGTFNHNGRNLYFSKRDFSTYYETFAIPKMKNDPAFVPYQLTNKIIYKNWNGDLLPINRDPDQDGNYMAKYILIEKN